MNRSIATFAVGFSMRPQFGFASECGFEYLYFEPRECEEASFSGPSHGPKHQRGGTGRPPTILNATVLMTGFSR